MKNINLLPEDGPNVEWSTEWLVKLLKLLEEAEKTEDFFNYISKSKEMIETSSRFANEVKNFLKENNLHKTSKDAQIILLSAHCPKRPDIPPR